MLSVWPRVILVLAIGATITNLGPKAPVDPDLTRVIIEGIVSGWESIRTLQVEYEMQLTSDQELPEGQWERIHFRGSLSKDGPRVRSKFSATSIDGSGDYQSDTYTDNVDVKMLLQPTSPNSRMNPTGHLEISNGGAALPFGEFLSPLLMAVVPDGSASPLADWLDKCKIVELNSLRDSEGNLQYELKGVPSGADRITSLRIRILAKQNFPVRQATIVTSSDRGRIERELAMSGFEDHSGILFPSGITQKITSFIPGGDGGGRTVTNLREISFKMVQINQPIEASAFDFIFPNGIVVQDRRTNTLYRWPPGSSREIPLLLPQEPKAAPQGWRFFGVPVLFILVSLPLLLAVAVVVWRIRARRAVKSVRLDR